MREEIQNLADRFVEITGEDRETVLYAAQLCGLAYEHSQNIKKGFRQSKDRLPSDPAKTYIRQLERLARKKPQRSALDFHEPGSFHLKRAMMDRDDFELLRRWESRGSLTTEADKDALLHDCTPVARDAIDLLRKSSKGAGRPVLHHQLTLIDNWAGIFHSLFGVTKNHNKGTRCRKLIAECAVFFDIDREELVDPFMESKTVKKALSKPPKFSGIQIAYKSNLPN